MISIIVCSINTVLLGKLSESIKKTIGVEYELVVVENQKLNWSISKAYNFAASKAKFNILCFVHEDIEFLTKNWGINLLKHLDSNNKIGVIGVAGSINKSLAVTSWWQPNNNNSCPRRINIIQMYKTKSHCRRRFYLNPKGKIKDKVVCLDGVFMVMKSEIWDEYKFDDLLLKGFHGYDVDFCLRIIKKYNNFVVYDILLCHASEGRQNMEWFEELVKVHYKFRKSLPIYSDKLSEHEILKNEQFLFKDNLNFLKKYGLSNVNLKKIIVIVKFFILLLYFKLKSKNGFQTYIY